MSLCVSELPRPLSALDTLRKPSFLDSESYSLRASITPIVAASSSRRRNRSSKSDKTLRQCLSFVASNLKLLPRALDLLVDGAGGDGGGSDFWKGFGWGGGPEWHNRRKLSFDAILVSVTVSVFWVLKGPEERDLGMRPWVWVSSLVGYCARSWKKSCIPGFLCLAVLMAVLWNWKQEEPVRLLHRSARLRIPGIGFRNRKKTILEKIAGKIFV